MSMLFLIGMPGVGKTYWARQLAKHHGLPMIDMDEYIEQQELTTIGSLFQQIGEDAFRIKENAALKDIIQQSDPVTIVACGGGTPCYHNNMELMQQAGTIAYLKADVQLLMEHIQHEAEQRPMLKKQTDPESFLTQLLAARQTIYEQADHILEAENISLTTFNKIIETCINQH